MLFIGGPWDGGYKDIKDSLTCYNVAEPPDAVSCSYSKLGVSTVPVTKIRRYTLRRFVAPGREFRFMADEQLSDADAMQKLLDNYRP